MGILSSSVFLGVALLAAGQEDCDEATGQCSASSAPQPPLRWRGYPYKVSNPVFAKTIYGGDYIRAAFAKNGFEGPVEGDDWDLLWTHRSQDGLQIPGGKARLANHCRYYGAAGDKCALAQHMSNLPKAESAGYRHFRTYELSKPEQAMEWRSAVKEDPSKYWVLKPCFGGASKGIQILSGQEAIEAVVKDYSQQSAVAQEYLDRPFLGFGGRKFHLRLYLFAPGWDPAIVFLYQSGLVFRSLKEFTNPGQHDVFSSISDVVEAVPLSELWEFLDSAADGGSLLPAATVRNRIEELLKSVLGTSLEESFGSPSGSPSYLPSGSSCFDLFGADVILDENLMPLVMEVNSGPNMWVSDHGEGNKEVLSAVKDPMIQQVTQWAALRLRRKPFAGRATAEELAVLKNFTRLL